MFDPGGRMPAFRCLIFAVMLFAAVPSWADIVAWDGRMPEDAPTTYPISGAACDSLLSDPPQQLPYKDLGSFQVDTDGEYTLVDLGASIGLDVAVFVFSAPFDPDMPQLNLVLEVDTSGSATLTAGQDYWLVVQRRCGGLGDHYTASLQGPGTIAAAEIPELQDGFWGEFDGTQPQADLGDGLLPYAALEFLTVRVPPDPATIFDASRYAGLDIKVHVYRGFFDPDNPLEGRVGTADTIGGYINDTGGTFTFVVQPRDAEALGEWAWVWRPDAPFPINSGLNDAWYRVDTPGQGVFLNVFPVRGEVFMGWFTYDVERPDASVGAVLGETGHRWMTGLGDFSGEAAWLQLEITEGGVFNTPFEGDLASHQFNGGTVRLEVHHCNRITMRYSVRRKDSEERLENVIELQRIVDSNVPLCRTLSITEAANPASVPDA